MKLSILNRSEMFRWTRICLLVVIVGLIPGWHVDGQSVSPSSTVFVSTVTSLPTETTSSSTVPTTTSTTTPAPSSSSSFTLPTTTTTSTTPAPSSTTTTAQPGNPTTLISVTASSTLYANTSVSSGPMSLIALSSIAMTSITGSTPMQKITPRPRGNMSLPETVAIITGALMLLLMVILFVGVALVLRYVKVKERSEKSSKRIIGTDGAFYAGLNPQSEQALVSSMSNQSLATSPSDPHLNVQGSNVYYNRGFEVDQSIPAQKAGGGAVSYNQNSAYQPIEMGSGSKQSKA